MEDKIAISLVKQGDLSGLESLVNRYQVQAIYAAFMIVFDRAESEDIVQAAFIKVAERIHQFDDTLPFAPWFFRIVVNDALKVAKKRDVILREPLDENVSRLGEWLIDPDPSPEQILEEKQVRENILQAIQSLPPNQRAAIVMRYYLDLSEADMIVRFERPLSTIKWWLRESRRRLRILLDSSSETRGKHDG